MTDHYDLHASLGYRLTYAARLAERRFEAALSPLGLSRTMWCVLLAAGQEGLSAPSDIAAFIGIDRTATSRALRALDDAGLVTRAAGTGDRRMTRVALTEAGQDRLAAASRAAAENATHFTAKLDPADRAALDTALDRLTAGEAIPVRGL